ncbi:kinase-like domain-containing protein [Blakeslea trispora]|nr:kinase-like domain-containing protein [Blakeslea trispora]
MNSELTQSTQPKAGVLTICLDQAGGIVLPQGAKVPENVGPVPVQHRNKRESINRNQYWWLPYVVLEFDKNEIWIDAVGGTFSFPVYHFRANFDVSHYSHVSFSFYLRQPVQPVTPSKSSSDLFLGRIVYQPNFTSTELTKHQLNFVGGAGALLFYLGYTPSQQTNQISVNSFDLLKVIGRGSFGKVYVVRKKDTNRIYAMKVLRKSRIISRSEVTHTMAEKTVLAKVRNPFIVPLKFAFQSPDKLYLVLAFINGGELFHHLQDVGRFDEVRARFYAAELFCALECLHQFDVVYRDLKPENILIDYNGHIALCDFGLCKLNMTQSERTNTFCGTPEYLAPELLLGQGYTKAVDWWTLGILLYEMLTGLPPFYNEDTNKMYEDIVRCDLKFPDGVMSNEAEHLLRGLLTRDPEQRLGHRGTEEIRCHPFFRTIDWNKLIRKQLQPPFKPIVESAYDTNNFDDEFTSEQPVESLVNEEDSHLSRTMQEQFRGFTYNSDGVMTDSYNSHQQASNLSGSYQPSVPSSTRW